MKTEDVIHFYWGQKVIFGRDKGIISRVSQYTREPMVRIKLEKGGSLEAWVSEIKLLLRPISSMTEEEAKEFINITYSNLESSSIGPIMVGQHDMEFHSGKTAYHLWWSSISPQEFVWLISKSFDIFYLIPSQQAIDITKLNKDAK